MGITGWLLFFAGLALVVLGVRAAEPAAQAAHRRVVRPVLVTTVLVVALALWVGRANPANGWYVVAAWPALLLPFSTVGARRAGLSGRAFQTVFAGQALAATGLVMAAYAAAQRATP